MTTIPRASLLFNKGNIGPQTRGHLARRNLKTWLKKKSLITGFEEYAFKRSSGHGKWGKKREIRGYE